MFLQCLVSPKPEILCSLANPDANLLWCDDAGTRLPAGILKKEKKNPKNRLPHDAGD